MIATQQRFTRNGLSCPICEGHSGMRQGRSERCAGYLSDNGEYAYCTREEYAGTLERNENTSPAAFCHKLYGPCNCGTQHNPPRLVTLPSNGHRKADFFTYDDPRATAHYPYYDEENNLLFATVRYEWPDKDSPKGHSKTIRQFHKEKGNWVAGIGNIRRVLYRLSELLKADRSHIVYLPEGENKVDALRRLGLLATCNPMGAGKWQKEYSAFFKGRHVVILPDNDQAGYDHAKQIAASLQNVAASVRTITLPNLPEKGDIIDWLKAGGTKEALEELCKLPKRKFTYASEIQPKEYQWLWEDRIAVGEFTLAVGDAGVGKGLTISKIIAHVTKGNPLPGDTRLFPGGVIMMSPEDSPEHAIVPRLMAAQADLTKVLLLDKIDEVDVQTERTYKRPVSFPEDTSILIEAIEDAHGALIIIDPILSMLSDRVDAHKNHAVRRAVGQVLDAARENDCALLGIMHTTKTQHPNVLFRSSSSSAFIEMARASLFFVPDPDGEPGQSGVIVNYKNNLRKKAPHIRYAIHQSDKNIGYITWEGISTYSEEELLNQESSVNNPKSAQELDIITVLKVNQAAMTVSQIHEKIQSGQSVDALEIMLRRKVEQGMLLKPSRGLYTYAGNPLYCATSVTPPPPVSEMSEMSNVGNVGFAKNGDSDIVGFMSDSQNGHNLASHAVLDESDISDMAFVATTSPIVSPQSMNGHHKPVETQNKPKIGQIIAQMVAQGYGYPKKCADSSHRGDTRWMPRQNPETGNWDSWYCCQCDVESEG